MGVQTSILLHSLVLLGLTCEVEGVADSGRRHLACTQHLHSEGFAQRLHGLQGLGEASCAAVAQQAVLHDDVPLSSRYNVVPVEHVMALAVLHRQIVVITHHSLVASLTDVYVGCAHWQHDHEIVAVPVCQNTLQSMRAYNRGVRQILLSCLCKG